MLYGYHHHRYVGMEQEPVGETRIEQPGKDVLFAIGNRDEVYRVAVAEIVEVIDDIVKGQ